MNYAELLSENREKIEKRLRELFGLGVSVFQLSRYALGCGCTGLTVSPTGLSIDDLEVFKDRILPMVLEVSDRFDLKPGLAYAIVGGDAGVTALHLTDYCDRCAIEYAGAGGRPRPDTYVLENFEGGGSDREIQDLRSSFEDLIRKKTGVPVYLLEMGVFALRCGCVGISTFTRGMRREGLDELLDGLDEIAEGLSINSDLLYATIIPGTEEVMTLNVKQLCEECNKRYRNPRADIYISRWK
ncbi:MAG: hypothetical protein CW694_05090 [Candidatus Syntrophoarchaeum sp. WYZ-LMO15]|nr:MAG: hypothetical protein CW694_05090 [Candidatus Syntrophoarchaeum sp. WYZ-LMO15]